ncbi:hypothetical protein NDU88_005915 [Pleurodeles waltl]|uniref:Uncharacterized protein n=1 Tax=Pleurodeles waltl TaxID=8319 RepID=A0AAV7QHE5_PLEWA|nr:hypothetical protein NDU88_005915 [Pleurodeles waltl]
MAVLPLASYRDGYTPHLRPLWNAYTPRLRDGHPPRLSAALRRPELFIYAHTPRFGAVLRHTLKAPIK